MRLYCRWYPRVTRSAASTTDVNSARGADETPDSVIAEDPGGTKYPRRPPRIRTLGYCRRGQPPLAHCVKIQMLWPRPALSRFDFPLFTPLRPALRLWPHQPNKFKFPFVDLWSFFRNSFAISRLAAQSTFCLLATNSNDRRSQRVTGGLELGYGFGRGDHCTIFIVAFSAGRWSSRCLEAYVRCFVSGRSWSQSEVHIKVMSFIAWQGKGVCVSGGCEGSS